MIITLGVLGVLLFLTLAFISMARMERRAAQHRTDATRAFLLARSGLEDALARLQAGQDPDFSPIRFRGADRNADGSVSVAERAFYPNALSVIDPSAGRSLRPSWPVLDPISSLPALLPWGYSGRLGPTQPQMYCLKASSGGFYVNGGDPAVPASVGYNAVLRRVLGTLAEVLQREEARPVLPADGTDLVDRRPPAGWNNLAEVARVLGWNQAKTAVFRPYLCFRAWTDKRVVAPNLPAGLALPKDYVSWGELLLDRRTAPDGSKAPDFERIGGRNVGRAPVNLAWASCRRPALIALMAGLAGVYLEEASIAGAGGATPCPGPGAPEAIGTLRAVSIQNSWTPADDCHLASDALAGRTVSSWQEFEALIEAIPFTGATTAQIQAKKDLLKANFNPNSDINKFNPDRSCWRSVDKSDLTVYSTEFSLGPLQAVDLESCGRVLGPRGTLLAERSLRGTVSPPMVVRLSTQRELVAEDLGSLDFPGDERDVRFPGHPRYVSESQGIPRTWGHVLDLRVRYGPSCFLNGNQGGFAKGVSLQSYPEPCYDAGAGLDLKPADWDGRVALASLETPDNDSYLVTAPVTDMKMLARFDEGLDLDLADGGNPQCRGPWSPMARLMDNNTRLVSRAELSNGLWDAAKPSTLHPDGVYSERDRAPGWLDRGSVHGYHGLLSFWVKNHFQLPVGDTRARNYVQMDNYQTSGHTPSDQTQFFFVGLGWDDNDYGSVPSLSAHFELGSREDQDNQVEHTFRLVPMDPASRRWRLVTFFWDFRAAIQNDTGELVLDGVDCASPDLYIPGSPTGQAMAEDITRNEEGGARPHAIVLGRVFSDAVVSCGLGADASFDEFAVWDFGGRDYNSSGDPTCFASFTPGSIPQDLALTRWREGRYYRGSAYARIPGPLTPVLGDQAAQWLSAPIRLPAGSRIRRVDWTFRRASDLPELAGDYVELALANLAGNDYASAESASRSTTAPAWTHSRQSWDVSLPAPSAFRLQAVFRRLFPLPSEVPVLDASSLDDVTLVYQPPGGLALLFWQSD